jgi:hypothetical protein
VVDLVEDGEREDLADARDGAKELEGLGVMDLSPGFDGVLELADDDVVAIGQCQVGLDGAPQDGIAELVR